MEDQVQVQMYPDGGDGFCQDQSQLQQSQQPNSSAGPDGDTCGQSQSQSQSQPQTKCRQLGEYDPNQNPCARIPGQHPFCPPGQVIGILPNSYIRNPFPRPVAKPCSGPPPRLPWKQCVENNLVNDQVRRPLSRWCHIRELPPVVIPSSEINRIRDKIQEREKLKAECEAAAAERECARQASYQRHSEWNYTVDSLLARKKQEEEDKQKQLDNEFFQLSKTLKENRDKYSAEAMARAKQQLLYRKGLIRDFHAALARSKTMKETQDLIAENPERKKKICQFPPDSKGKDQDPCRARMMYENDRVDYTVKKEVKPQECRPELLELLRCDEKRVPERKAELEKEKSKLKEIRTVEALPWPENYVKFLQEPKCEDSKECKKRLGEKKASLLKEIQDHQENDAFIEFHEKEIDRQACEYNQYKRKVDRLRKQKEKQLIEEKVARNIRNSEKAAEMLVAKKTGQKERADEYYILKEKWQLEHVEQAKQTRQWRENLLQRASQDYIMRQDLACCKRAQIDASVEWEKERCNAVQNYERECEIANKKREKAEEIAKFQLEQIMEKTEREEAERGWNAAWGEKARMNYACEMKEMKEYALAQIKDWKAKGRPTYPMTHAMKKWDYDSGMNPFLYAQTQCTDETCPTYQSSAQRLGFCNGGT